MADHAEPKMETLGKEILKEWHTSLREFRSLGILRH